MSEQPERFFVYDVCLQELGSQVVADGFQVHYKFPFLLLLVRTLWCSESKWR